MTNLNDKIEKDAQGGALVKLGDKSYRPEEVSAMILQKINLSF